MSRARASAAQISEWTSAFFGSTTDHALIFAGPDGKIVAWLGASERLLGYTAEEAFGKPLSCLFTSDDLAREIDVQETQLARRVGRSEDDRWHVRKDGSQFWASGVLNAIVDDRGEVVAYCKLLRDRTDARMQIRRLENEATKLQKKLAANRQFIASTVHELRNSLMPLTSAVTLLRRPDALPMRERALNIMDNQLTVLTRLVDDLTRLDRDGTAPLNAQDVNLNDALASATDSLRFSAEHRGQTLALTVPDAPIVIAADPVRLQQMLHNLIGNAIKFTPGNGHVSVSASSESQLAVVRIEDDGRGIAPNMLTRIFELFTRETDQTGVDGLGVGLAVVKQLVTLHGGSVEARSPGHGKGSLFLLRLPLAHPPDAR